MGIPFGSSSILGSDEFPTLTGNKATMAAVLCELFPSLPLHHRAGEFHIAGADDGYAMLVVEGVHVICRPLS